MDLELSDDQELLRATTERYLESAMPPARVRELADTGAAPGADYFRGGGELGWFAMLVPEEHGGGSVSGGTGIADAVILAEERGKTLQPGPFIPTNVVAYALGAAGSAEQRAQVLPHLVAGEQSAAWAVADATGDWNPDAGVRVSKKDTGYVLSGAKGLVEGADTVDWLLVSAVDDRGAAQFLVTRDTPGIEVQRLQTFDITRPLCDVRFDDVVLPHEARVGDAADTSSVVDRQFEYAAAMITAESVGAMDRLFETALDYAKVRTAFGRPIGSFQAVKHLLADTSLLLEESKAVAVAIARALEQGSPDAAETASIAKAFVSESGVDLAQNCWQVFGGIGYTWEHDLHLYLRRLTANASLYGEPAWHREHVCRLQGL
ncbi:MAG TPA: acyl-CoA dehydrogenase family protein [Acidimicrobiia bacterium]|nr:acyl-CoA dehydrogenase family protein [Acidimicrobiia bacterium]